MHTPAWRLAVLGPGGLTDEGGRPRRLEGKPLALLTYLALEGSSTRARVADLLWPGVPEATARNNLVILLRRLRQNLGAELVQAGDRLNLRPEVQVDARSLLDGGPPDEPALFSSGPLLDGQDWPELPELADWLLIWRERLDEGRARLALEIAGRHEAASRWSQALTAVRRALDWNPLSEDLHRAQMRLLYLGGDPAAALRAFEACRELLRRELRTEPMGITLDLARLIERGGQVPSALNAPAPSPHQPLRPPTLVGREAEWAQMEAAWARGQAIILVGEAGAGKSRLAGDFVASKGEALLFEGRPGDPMVPYATAVRNLRRVLAQPDQPPLEGALRGSLSRLMPELGGEPDRGEGADARMRQAIMTVLGRGLTGKAAVISDDMQFSDDASIEVSALLSANAFPLGRPGGLPHIVVCYRRGELAPRHEAALDGLLAAGFAARIEVGPLSETAVTALLDGLTLPGGAATGRQVARLAGGNATFVLELARHVQAGGGVVGSLPPHLEALVQERLGRLPQASLSVARAASVLQNDFTVDQVAELLDMPLLEAAAAWDELEGADIARGERFSHDLVAEAVLAGMPGVVRRLLHRAAARLLARQGAAPARVAQQWLNGGNDADGAQWLLRAAESARDAFRPREATAFYARAAGLFDRLGQPDEAFEALIFQFMMLGDTEDERAAQQTLIGSLMARAVTPLQQAQARRHAASLLGVQNDPVGMERMVREGLAFVQGTGDLTLEADLYEALAGAMLQSRQPEQAKAALERLLTLSEQVGNVARQAVAHDGLGQVAGYTSPQEALRLFERAEALCLSVQDFPQAAAIVTKQARMQQKLGRFRAALDTAVRAQAYLKDEDSYRARQLINTYFRALCWQALGEHATALAQVREAVQTHAASESTWLDALEMQRARLLLDLGQVEKASTAAQHVLASTRLVRSMHVDRSSMWAAVLAAQGHTAQALAALDQAEGLLDSFGDVYLQPRLRLERAALLSPASAAPLIELALQEAQAHGLRGLELAAQTRLARAQLALGQPATLPEDGDPDAVVSRAELLLTRAQVLRQLASVEATEALQDARRWLSERSDHLPPEFREAFLNGVPLHRTILESVSATPH